MQKSFPRGAILLFNVLIIGVISIASAVALTRGSFDGFVDSDNTLSSWNARADVFGCLDEIIIQLKKSSSFSASTIFSGTATCDVQIVTPNSDQATVTVSLTEGMYFRQVTATIELDPFEVTSISEP